MKKQLTALILITSMLCALCATAFPIGATVETPSEITLEPRPAVMDDALIILIHLAKIELLSEEEQVPLDLNYNSKIDIGDMLIVLMGLANIIPRPMIVPAYVEPNLPEETTEPPATTTEPPCGTCNMYDCECMLCDCGELVAMKHPFCNGPCGLRVCVLPGGGSHSLRLGCNHSPQRYSCDIMCTIHYALDCQNGICCTLTSSVCTYCNRHECNCTFCDCGVNIILLPGIGHPFCGGSCSLRVCQISDIHFRRSYCNHITQRYSCDVPCSTHYAYDCQNELCCTFTSSACINCNRHDCVC